MSILIIDNFELSQAKPIDNRFVVGSGYMYTTKDQITHKYPGLRVYDMNDSKFYNWNGLTFSAEYLSPPVGNSVTAVSSTAAYVPKFNSASIISNSQIYD